MEKSNHFYKMKKKKANPDIKLRRDLSDLSFEVVAMLWVNQKPECFLLGVCYALINVNRVKTALGKI